MPDDVCLYCNGKGYTINRNRNVFTGLHCLSCNGTGRKEPTVDVKRTEFVWRDGQYKCNCPNDQSGTYVLAAEYDAEKARADAAEARVKELEAKLASVPTATIADDATISVMTLPTPGGDVAAMLARIAKYDHDDGVSPLVAHDFGDAAALLESQAAALAAKDAEIEKLNRANKSLQNDLNEYLGR